MSTEKGNHYKLGKLGFLLYSMDAGDVKSLSVWPTWNFNQFLEMNFAITLDGTWWKGKETNGEYKFFWWSRETRRDERFKLTVFIGRCAFWFTFPKKK